ncbi:hypothetical protein [Desulfitobacterium hafniense]|uniref:hypothetical protein n=1 Tax=Desulfitobacterium hafniense TaxID=49338 RepID=UPI001AEC03A3|nr:hypothetical protein [Desulfitobacterium hafniense]
METGRFQPAIENKVRKQCFRGAIWPGRKPDEAFAQAATPQRMTWRRRSRRSGGLER